MTRRIVVTGMGALTPLGNDISSTWTSLLAGRSGIAPITQFDTTDFASTIAGEVKDFSCDPWISKKEARKMDRFIHLAIAAADMCVQDSGLDLPGDQDPERVGVIVGAGLGGMRTIEECHETLRQRGPKRITPFFIPKTIVNLAPGHISIRIGAKGPNFSPVSACATGNHAIGEAMRMIQRDDADIIIAGGSEATITPLGVGGFTAMKALSTRNDEPEKASRPFDADRDGFVAAEGAGILALEELEHAKKRGAKIYAELTGYALTGDAHHITAPAPGGEGGARCMRLTLKSAKLSPEDVQYINAHGTSTPGGDLAETQAIKTVFGEHARKVSISSTKSMTGHMLGAAGGVESIFTILALQNGQIPPTINLENPDPDCDLDYVPNEARDLTIKAAITNSFGFGGTNASLLFTKFQG